MRERSKIFRKEFEKHHETEEAGLSDGKNLALQESKEAERKPRVKIKPTVILS
jgi:hypothetical protein